MRNITRRTVGVTVIALVAAVSLTACGQSLEDVKRDGEFAKACHDAGGYTYSGGFAPELRCGFTDK